MPVDNPRAWNDLLLALPGNHLLQSWEWGEFKSRHGWKAERLAWLDGQRPMAAAQVLRRSAPLRGLSARLTVLYCPKGPCLAWPEADLRRRVLQDLAGYARSHASVFLKIDPELPRGFGLPGEDDSHLDFLGTEVIADLKRNGWQAAAPVQFQNSMRIDLRPSEAELLERMKPKTRYNLRLAARHGVTVRHAGPAELERLYPIFVETSVRDGFVIRNREYYLDVWGTFVSSGLAQPILAEVEGEAVAAVIVFRFGRTAYFLYGMSRDAHREKMPNYMLQWEAIRWARRQGCEVYDLWGAPDRADPKDPLWGVYRFKSGLGAHGVQWLGAWDYATGRPLYWLYSVFLPRVLAVLRSGRMAQVRRFME